MFPELTNRVLDSPDKRLKKHDWIGVVIHHTGVGDRTEVGWCLWKKLYTNIADWLATKDGVYVSAHFLIGRDGKITQIVDPRTHVAYHAGKSGWWNPIDRTWINGCNNQFIGIELLGDGNKFPFSDDQVRVTATLTKRLIEVFPTIHPSCLVGHEFISPGRKTDPGKYWDHKKFFKMVYS
jgi:N-acetyl-anhydromuramyl-L-alanine amidase AmpD